jgi:hypothetical protein
MARHLRLGSFRRRQGYGGQVVWLGNFLIIIRDKNYGNYEAVT